MADSTDPTNGDTAEDSAVGQDAPSDMTGASHQEVADLVDDLEEKALADAGNPQQKIADARTSGTDRAAADAEPPV